MDEVKTFKLEQKFDGVQELYNYLFDNIDSVGELIEVEVQKPLENIYFCLIGKESITERNILFFASKSEFLEGMGELILLAGTFNSDVVVMFLPEISTAHLEPLNWLHRICNSDTDFFVGEVSF